MKVIVLVTSEEVNDDLIAKCVQELSNKSGELVPLTILSGSSVTPQRMERPVFQQHIEDILTICDAGSDIITASNFWNQVHSGRITMDTIKTIVEKANEYKSYVRTRDNARLIVELCSIAAGMMH